MQQPFIAIVQKSSDKEKTWSEVVRFEHRWVTHAIRNAYSSMDYFELCRAMHRSGKQQETYLYRVVDLTGKILLRPKQTNRNSI